MVARSGNDILACMFMGNDPRYNEFFIGFTGDECVGMGASIDADGGNALIIPPLGGTTNAPIELIEERYPVFIEQYSLRQDSGGAGKFRGGLGIEKHIRTAEDVTFYGLVEQTKSPAWGLFGGKSALPNVGVLYAGTEEETTFGKIKRKLKKGDKWVVKSGGGGGWGDPRERDPAAVLKDVVGGYISLAAARDDYGIRIEQKGGKYFLIDDVS